MFDPTKEKFGSRHFMNRVEKDGKTLLPPLLDSFKYFEVGNLNRRGAEQLPQIIQREYNRKFKNSNTNHIIFSLNNFGLIGKVYVTEHIDTFCFNPKATFCIDTELLRVLHE